MSEAAPKLRIDDGSERIVSVDEARVVIGNGTECDIVVDDPKCSDRHCKLESTPDGWVVIDLESRHGTMVNGSFTNKFHLHSGDRIEIGDSELVFELGDETGASSPPADAGRNSASSSRPSAASSPGAQSERSGTTREVPPQTSMGLMVYLALFLVVVVGGGIGYYFVSQNRVATRESRQAFWKASELYDREEYDQAIAAFQEVSRSHTEDLFGIAQRSIDRAKRITNNRREQSKRREAERQFRTLVDEVLKGERRLDKIKPEFQTFGEYLSNLPGPLQNTMWYKHYERISQQMNELYQKEVSAANDGASVRENWQKAKKRARSLRDNDQYGQAAERIVRFRFVHPEFARTKVVDLRSELQRIRTNAEAHLNSRKNSIDQLLDEGQNERARDLVLRLKGELYSYYEPLASFYLEAVKKEQVVRQKLDKTGDSS